MESKVYDVNNYEVQMLMVLKLLKLQRESIPGLVYQQLENYLTEEVWKKGAPSYLHVAANDILSITATDIVKYLSVRAIKEGSSGKLEDYMDVIGG